MADSQPPHSRRDGGSQPEDDTRRSPAPKATAEKTAAAAGAATRRAGAALHRLNVYSQGEYPHNIHPALVPGIGIDEQRRRYSLDRIVFALAGLLTVAFVIWGVTSPESVAEVAGTSFTWTMENLGWLFNVVAIVVLIFLLCLAFSKYGRIPLGKDGEKPEFSTFSWTAMLFAAGIGIGVLFFGPSEPLTYFHSPAPLTNQAETIEALHGAMAQTYYHWGVHAWAMYALVGGAVAYAAYRRGRVPLMSSIFRNLFGQSQTDGFAGKLIDIFAIIATLFGTAASLGIAAMQIGQGWTIVSGNEVTNTLLILIIGILTVGFVLSAVSGVARGIRYLSNINIVLTIGIISLVFLLGPTLFLLNLVPSSFVEYFGSLFELMGRSASWGTETMDFQSAWTVFYWAWWISWSPFVGVFIARISRGRTIRQFILGVILIPSSLLFVAYGIMGGTSIWMYREGLEGFSDEMPAAEVLFTIIDHLPYVEWLPAVIMVVLAIFFITSADSASVVMGIFSTRGDLNPRKSVVVFWGLVMTGVAVVMLLTGGDTALQGLQSLVTVTAVPFAVIMLLIMVAWLRDVRTDPRALRTKYAEKALRDAVIDGVDRYGDDFTLQVAPTEPGLGAGAGVDSEDDMYTEWYQRTDENGDPIGYDFTTGQWEDGWTPEEDEDWHGDMENYSPATSLATSSIPVVPADAEAEGEHGGRRPGEGDGGTAGGAPRRSSPRRTPLPDADPGAARHPVGSSSRCIALIHAATSRNSPPEGPPQAEMVRLPNHHLLTRLARSARSSRRKAPGPRGRRKGIAMSEPSTVTPTRRSRRSRSAGDRPGFLVRALRVVERIGNLLPHPFWLFIILAVVVVVLSAILEALGVGAENPADGEQIAVQSLLTPEGFQRMVTDAVENFVTFPPLGLIITVMLGVAVAEGSGLISAAIRVVVSRVSRRWLTFTVALAGVTGSVASDAIYVILIPLAAAAFKASGRSAVLGAVVAFGSASAGYNASLLITASDPLLAGISTSAAQLIDPDHVVSPVANYFFSAASAVVLALVVTLVTELLLVRMTERMKHEEDATGGAATAVLAAGRDLDDGGRGEAITDEVSLLTYTRREVAALRASLLALAGFLAVYFSLLLLPGSPFQAESGDVLDSPLLTDIAVPIALAFLAVGITYGVAAGTITRPRDIPELMGRSIKELSGVVVLFFAAAQFIAYFSWSNIGMVLAIEGAHLLERLDLPVVVMFAGVVLLVALFNLTITSGSAQYTLMAPVLVPMLMLVGTSPEVTQMLFRIGDSPTNIISPMSPYFALVLGYLQRYYPKAGIGTLVSLTLPVSVALLCAWFLFFVLWWALGIPLGPGVPVR
ncbi:BCCT family transporter [Nesterenkonia sp. PF2B19]|uniref:BCCT family transporter n=2 Tax=unclassified Nesterenkonia TaxID=2629769 RepID=UPI00111C567C|nr:BCCT family transporter [Nesterenkonia sp. PF2B19]